eukprot:1189411-Prorocentrum_minimum.AAC.2
MRGTPGLGVWSSSCKCRASVRPGSPPRRTILSEVQWCSGAVVQVRWAASRFHARLPPTATIHRETLPNPNYKLMLKNPREWNHWKLQHGFSGATD